MCDPKSPTTTSTAVRDMTSSRSRNLMNIQPMIVIYASAVMTPGKSSSGRSRSRYAHSPGAAAW